MGEPSPGGIRVVRKPSSAPTHTQTGVGIRHTHTHSLSLSLSRSLSLQIDHACVLMHAVYCQSWKLNPVNIPPLRLNPPPTHTYTHTPLCLHSSGIPAQNKGTSRTASDSNFSPFLSSPPRRRPTAHRRGSPHPTLMVVRPVRSGISHASHRLVFTKAK